MLIIFQPQISALFGLTMPLLFVVGLGNDRNHCSGLKIVTERHKSEISRHNVRLNKGAEVLFENLDAYLHRGTPGSIHSSFENENVTMLGRSKKSNRINAKSHTHSA